MTFEKKVSIMNETGLHARPASEFVEKASKFSSEIKIIFGDREVNAKSIMGLLSLGISQGSEIKLKTDGEDSEEALKELVNFIEVELPKEDE